jgi:hypothetical protein
MIEIVMLKMLLEPLTSLNEVGLLKKKENLSNASMNWMATLPEQSGLLVLDVLSFSTSGCVLEQ